MDKLQNIMTHERSWITRVNTVRFLRKIQKRKLNASDRKQSSGCLDWEGGSEETTNGQYKEEMWED